MRPIQDRQLLRWGLVLVCLLSLAGLLAFSSLIEQQGWADLSLKLRLIRGVGWAGVAVLAGMSLLAWVGGTERILSWLKVLVGRISSLRELLLPVMLALLGAYPALLYTGTGTYLSQNWTRHAIFLWLLIAMTLVMVAYWHKPWREMSAAAALSMAVVYHLVTFFPHISTAPFSLWWSETTRYYLASTYLGQQLYGQDLPLAMKDLTRYLIQAAPFLIKGSPLWVHRLWQVILRFTTTYIAGYLLGRRLKLTRKQHLALFSMWAGLFLFQGPVFYHLIVVAMLAFWLADARNFWKTLLATALASIYAGFSRINWIPMPGLIAAVYYFLQVPVQGKDFKAVVRYLRSPVIWVAVGLAFGLGANQLWVVNSGNPPAVYETSFTSYMLWDRLLPNPSYALGILPATLIVIAPLAVYLLFGLRSWRDKFHPVRLLGLIGIAAALFGGGLLVSVKIGGGTNLHNMDVFFVVLLVMASDLYFGQVRDESGQPVAAQMPAWLQAAVIALPVIFVITYGGLGARSYDPQTAGRDLARLQKYADQAVAGGGEVLFISQRHLLTFGLIEDVPLVHDYEKMLLQEMAMGKNQEYLAQFGAAMAGQRYAMIVVDPLPRRVQDPAVSPLAMENNVVFETLVPLILCAYEVEESLLDGQLDILIPRPNPTCQTGGE